MKQVLMPSIWGNKKVGKVGQTITSLFIVRFTLGKRTPVSTFLELQQQEIPLFLYHFFFISGASVRVCNYKLI
jgi:hypothetical protein